MWPWRVSLANTEVVEAGEQLVGGKVPFLCFWFLEKEPLSSFRGLPTRLFSCLSSHGCCATGLETKGTRKKRKKGKLRLQGWVLQQQWEMGSVGFGSCVCTV